MDLQRVVRTRVPLGADRWLFGTGYVVAPGAVLTAGHVLGERATRCGVRAYPCGPAQEWLPAVVRRLHPTADAVVLEVPALGEGWDPVPWGAVTGAAPVCWTAVGYPQAGLDGEDRHEEHAYGRLAPGSRATDGGLALTVESRRAQEARDGTSGWAGLSGAAVFAGDLLIGLVTADPQQWRAGLEGVRSARLLEDVELARWCRAPRLLQVVGGPSPAASPALGVPAGRRLVGERISACVPHWQDRTEVRAELRAGLLDPTGPRILCVTGRGGIGKSATVQQVLVEFEDVDLARDPQQDLDGIALLSSRTGLGALTAARVVHGLTRLLPDPTGRSLRDAWESDGDGALPLLWEALRGRRCVLVLDDLDSLQDPDTGRLRDEGLVTLLDSLCRAPSAPRVVTTSRRALVLPPELGPHVRELEIGDGLQDRDAVRLLRTISRDGGASLAQHADEDLARAVRRLSGVPRGIELLADLLQQEPMALQDLLESDDTLDALVEQLVSRAYERADQVGKRVLEVLALAEVPLPERELPAVLDGLEAPADVRRALRSLARRREVGYDPGACTVRLHPLDSDWLRARLARHSPEGRRTLDLRLAAWWRRRRTPFDTWRTLADAVPHRREYRHRWRAGDAEGALAVLAEVADVLARKGETASLRGAVAAAEPLVRDGRGRMHLEECRAAAEFFGGSLVRAEQALRAARDVAVELGLSADVDRLEVEIGASQRHRGECAGAAATFTRLLARAELARSCRVRGLFELGLTWCYLRDWEAAGLAADALVELLGPGDPPSVLAWPYDVRALARLGLGDHDGALAAADRAIALYRESPTEDNVGYLYNVRGLVHLEQQRLGQAEVELRNGVQLARSFSVDRLEGICLLNLAWVLLHLGRRQEAAEAARTASARLSSTACAGADSASVLARLCTSPVRDAAEVEAALLQVVEGCSSNSDLHSPSTTTVRRLASALCARQPVSADLPLSRDAGQETGALR